MSVPSVVVELVRVVVLADDPVSRGGVVSGLREVRTLHVVDDREAARADVVVCVADDPVRAALLVRQVLASGARRAVAVVGALDDTALLALVEAGACGLLRRSDATPEALAHAVRTADDGDGTSWTCSATSATCSDWAATCSPPTADLWGLTTRVTGAAAARRRRGHHCSAGSWPTASAP